MACTEDEYWLSDYQIKAPTQIWIYFATTVNAIAFFGWKSKLRFLLMVQAQKRQETPYGCFHPHPNVDGAVHHVGRRADHGVPPAEAENSILDWHNWTWATSLMTKSTSAFSSPSPLCLAKSWFFSRNQSLWNPTFQHSMDVSTVLTASTCMIFPVELGHVSKFWPLLCMLRHHNRSATKSTIESIVMASSTAATYLIALPKCPSIHGSKTGTRKIHHTCAGSNKQQNPPRWVVRPRSCSAPPHESCLETWNWKKLF